MTAVQAGLKAYIEAQVPEAGKSWPVQVPQDAAYPAWSYEVIDDDQLLSHGGGTGFYKARIQIRLSAKETESASTYGNLSSIATQIRAKLDGYKGNMNGVQVEFCKTMSSDDFADQKQLPTVSIDVLINYKA
jgi:predicted ATP-dependent Lon-type protease